jgi:hypothetical protein
MLPLSSINKKEIIKKVFFISALSEHQVIYCRESAFFNGWPEDDMKVGGHLFNATNIQPHWLDEMPQADRSDYLLNQKNLNKEKPTTSFFEL